MKQELTVIEPIKNLIKKEQTGFGLNIQIQNPFKIVPLFKFLFNDIHNIKDSLTIFTNFEYQILREKICGAFHWFGYGCSCWLHKDPEIIFLVVSDLDQYLIRLRFFLLVGSDQS